MWDDTARYFTEFYPDNAGDLPELRKVFDEVRACEPVPDPQGMTVDIVLVEGEDGGRYDVYGRIPGEEEQYALDFYLFREWTGLRVEKDCCGKCASRRSPPTYCGK